MSKNYCTKYKIELTVRPVRDLNTGPLAPKARIIPLDQQALYKTEMNTYKVRIY